MLSANGDLFKTVTYSFVLSLSKHEWIIFRGSLMSLAILLTSSHNHDLALMSFLGNIKKKLIRVIIPANLISSPLKP